MRRNVLNYWIALAMFTLVLGVVFIGFLLGFVIPRGSGGPEWQRALWGLGRHDWADIHKWLAVGLCALLVVHLWLHWDWIVATTKRVFGRA